jgi:hypothetical protein
MGWQSGYATPHPAVSNQPARLLYRPEETKQSPMADDAVGSPVASHARA